jgi:hypothetical protein
MEFAQQFIHVVMKAFAAVLLLDAVGFLVLGSLYWLKNKKL